MVRYKTGEDVFLSLNEQLIKHNMHKYRYSILSQQLRELSFENTEHRQHISYRG